MIAAEIAPTDPGLVAALAEAGLPTDDLAEPGRTFFAFRTDAGTIVGYAGAEPAGAAALLRSVVVVPERRGQGDGQRITLWMLDLLAGRGVRDVYLLTTTAERLFERCGFRRIERADAPAAIRASMEFTALCPVTAVLMQRKEDGHGHD